MVAENVTYFDSFRVQHIPKEIRKFITNKNVTLTFCRIPAYDLIMCKYFCIVFIDFMLQGDQSIQIYFLVMNIENDKTVYKCFEQNLNKLKMCCNFWKKYRKYTKIKHHILIYYVYIKTLKNIGLINDIRGHQNNHF